METHNLAQSLVSFHVMWHKLNPTWRQSIEDTGLAFGDVSKLSRSCLIWSDLNSLFFSVSNMQILLVNSTFENSILTFEVGCKKKKKQNVVNSSSIFHFYLHSYYFNSQFFVWFQLACCDLLALRVFIELFLFNQFFVKVGLISTIY